MFVVWVQENILCLLNFPPTLNSGSDKVNIVQCAVVAHPRNARQHYYGTVSVCVCVCVCVFLHDCQGEAGG